MIRLGICQIFYTRKIPNFFIFSREKRINCNKICKKNEKWRCWSHLFWRKCQCLCNYLLKYKLTKNCFVETQAWIRLIIGPESDHWQSLSLTDSLTDWLTDCRLVNLIDVTMACEDAYSKLIEVVAVANVSDEDRDGNTLLQIWKRWFGHKA